MRRFLVPALFLAVGAEPAVAQVRLEVQPAIGVYASFSDFTQPATPAPFGFAETLSQRTAVALGAQMTAWLGTRAGIRALIFTAPSAVKGRGPIQRDPVPARVTIGGVEALVPLRGVTGPGRAFVTGGAILIRRSGQAYDGFQGTRDIGGTIGLGSQLRLTPRLSLQGDVRALLYQLQLTSASGQPYPSAFQTDFLAHVGLVVALSPPSGHGS